MNGALVTTWGRSIPGREAKGLEVFGRALAYWDEMAKEGRIHSHQEFFASGDDVAGMLIVAGNVDELRTIEMEDDYRALIGDASLIVEDFRIRLMAGGDSETVTEGVTSYLESLQRLGIT